MKAFIITLVLTLPFIACAQENDQTKQQTPPASTEQTPTTVSAPTPAAPAIPATPSASAASVSAEGPAATLGNFALINMDDPCLALQQLKTGLDFANKLTQSCSKNDCGEKARAMRSSWQSLSNSINDFCVTLNR